MPGTQEVLIKGWSEGDLLVLFLATANSPAILWMWLHLLVPGCWLLPCPWPPVSFSSPFSTLRLLSKHLKPVIVPCGRHQMGRNQGGCLGLTDSVCGQP